MSFSGKDDGDFVVLESYFPFAFNKEPVDFGGIAAFKPSELLSQHGIEGISDHGHDDVKVYLDQDWGRERIEIEKLDGLGDNVFNPPPSGVIANQQSQPSGVSKSLEIRKAGFSRPFPRRIIWRRSPS